MPHFLAAAVAAKVKRFVPCEFGVNTFWVEKVCVLFAIFTLSLFHSSSIAKGAATIFDAKREFSTAVMASGLNWTMLYTGGTAPLTLPHKTPNFASQNP